MLTNSYSQNMIIAGQTTGTNIYYTDYIPDTTIIAGENPDGLKLDLDGNGTDDLHFYVGVFEYLPLDLRTWSTVKLLNSNIKICLDNDSLFWIDKILAGDTINENNIWGSNTDTVYYLQKYHYWTYPPPGGEIREGEWHYCSAYLGFQITFPGETFHGWIYMYSDEFHLTVKESAVRGLTVEIPEVIVSENMLYLYPNPCSKILTIESTMSNYMNKTIEILNTFGVIEKTFNVTGNKTTIDIELLRPGMYFIKLKDDNNIIAQAKLLKI